MYFNLSGLLLLVIYPSIMDLIPSYKLMMEALASVYSSGTVSKDFHILLLKHFPHGWKILSFSGRMEISLAISVT